MKSTLPWLLAAPLFLLAPGCIFVHVRGDLDELWDDLEDEDDDAHDFRELKEALEGCLIDPAYDFDLTASPWHAEVEWTVRYAGTGAEGHAAFARAKEAVLRRIQREGAVVTAEANEGPHAWSCEFERDGDDGEASVRLVENANEEGERPHQLEVVWEEDD